MPHQTDSPSRGEVTLTATGFLLLAFAFTWPLGLLDGAMPFGGGDGLASYFPFMLRSHRPVAPEVAGAWDPTLFTGLPESHSPMGRYYPPVVLLYSLLAPGPALSVALVLHHAWAALGAYLLARASGLSRGAAALAGVVFGFGGFLTFHRGHVPMQHGAAWLPWVLWSLERFRATGAFLWVAVTGTLLTLQALAGQVQLIVMGGLVWITYLAYFGLAGPGPALSRGRFLLGGFAACVLGAIGSLPQVLPLLEVASWSGYGHPDPEFFHTGELKPRFLAGLLGPHLFGGRWGVAASPGTWGLTEHGLFYGVLPLAVALAGLGWSFGRWRRSVPVADGSGPTLTSFMVLLLIANLMLIVGRATPLHGLLGYLPVYNLFHVPARHSWIFGLALGWLAGLGLDRLRQGDDAARRLAKQSALALALLVIAAAVMVVTFRSWADRPGWTYPGFGIPLLSALAALGVLALLVRRTPARRVLVRLVPLLALGELWYGIGRHELNPAVPAVLTCPEDFPAVVGELHRLQADRLPPRCLIEAGVWQAGGRSWRVPASYGSVWGLSALSTYSQSMPGSLTQLLHLNPYGEAAFPWVLAEERGLSAVGGRFLVTGKPLLPLAPGLGYRVAGRDDLTWSADQCWPGHPSPLDRGPLAGLATLVPLMPGETYLIAGELAGPNVNGRLRVVKTRHREREVVGEQAFTGTSFACLATLGPSKAGIHWITLECEGTGPPRLERLELWHLLPAFADVARLTDAHEVARRLREETRQPYPVVAQDDQGLRIHENPNARPLATLVQEVRPADSDRDAARMIATPGRPVRELAYVVAPEGRSGGRVLEGARYFEAGTVQVCTYRPDDITLRTTTTGEGFVVLAVTRCRGWSATVDGTSVPLHAVDGPLMGVMVPPGEHEVRFRFRPVLVSVGTVAAAAALGGAWLIVLALRWRSTARTRAVHGHV